MLDRFVSWRPATFFDHLAARGQAGFGNGGGWEWNASDTTAAQIMLKGSMGVGVRRLTSAGPEDQPDPTWLGPCFCS